MNDEELDNLRKKISGEIPTGGGSGNGIGLKNVQDRLRMAFGEEYGIEIATKEGCYTKVCVKIPLRR
jgi:two-component system sensor histidine kinase YesM